MVNDCGVCYVADLNFVWPTLISAMRVRHFIPPHKASIYIFLTTEDDKRIRELRVFAEAFGIRIDQMSTELFAGIEWKRSNKTHVPLASLGRFFLDSLLPDTCQRIVYLDGDTWIRRNPSPLIDFKVPDGKLAAVEDISFFCRHDITKYGRFVRSYFDGLGVKACNGYFNAGVFTVRRNTWRTIAKEALEFFIHHTEACKYHDQSALNAVIGDRRLRLSPAWNFQTPYRYWNVEHEIDPVIYHFTQGPKPWTGPVEPWPEIYSLYEQMRPAFSSLKLPVERLSRAEIANANARSQKQRRLLRYLLAHRLLGRRQTVRRLVATSVGELAVP